MVALCTHAAIERAELETLHLPQARLPSTLPKGGQGFLRVRLPYPAVVILLDRKNAPIGLNTVSIGSLTANVVHMREVFKPAILANAAALLCGHNHPSGDPAPSREDRALTQRLVDAGKLLGMSLIDHVVIGDGTTAFFSFADQGLL